MSPLRLPKHRHVRINSRSSLSDPQSFHRRSILRSSITRHGSQLQLGNSQIEGTRRPICRVDLQQDQGATGRRTLSTIGTNDLGGLYFGRDVDGTGTSGRYDKGEVFEGALDTVESKVRILVLCGQRVSGDGEFEGLLGGEPQSLVS